MLFILISIVIFLILKKIIIVNRLILVGNGFDLAHGLKPVIKILLMIFKKNVESLKIGNKFKS